jgi:hypothetical protein
VPAALSSLAFAEKGRSRTFRRRLNGHWIKAFAPYGTAGAGRRAGQRAGRGEGRVVPPGLSQTDRPIASINPGIQQSSSNVRVHGQHRGRPATAHRMPRPVRFPMGLFRLGFL